MPDEKQKIIDLLKKEVLGDQMPHHPLVYLSKRETNAPGVATWDRIIEPPANADVSAGVWVAFIDNMPGANYEHPVQYAFVDTHNDAVYVVDATTPPDDLEREFSRVKIEQWGNR